jgi:hypothetical protein
MLYDENKLDKYKYQKFLDKNTGFLKLLPQNRPVKVKVNCYIVKINVVNSISLLKNYKPEIHLEFSPNEKITSAKFDSFGLLIGK